MNIEKKWTTAVAKKLEGRTITQVRYLTPPEMEAMGFYANPIVLILDDGSYLFPQSDDEGNNGGALATGYIDLPVIPVI